MPGITGGPGLFFRVLLAGITSMLVMSTMSIASRFVTGPPDGSRITGGFLGTAPSDVALLYNAGVLLIGVLTFLGSFYVVSKK